jgi:hypothetical protein
MKTALRLLSRWLMVIMATILLSGSFFGQASNDECITIYNKFLENRKGPEVEKLHTAVVSGKEYLTKCGSLADGEKLRDYVSAQTPKVEATLQDTLDFQNLKTALNANDVAKSFELGKKILEKKPDSIDIMLALTATGYDAAFRATPVDKFNDETLRLAKTVLEKLNDPAKSAGTVYFKSDKCSDGRINAIGWMNFIIGDLTWSKLKDQKAALPYLYKSTQDGCATLAKPDPYQLIGSLYFNEFQRIEADRQAKIKVAGDKETDETNTIYALELGYVERMMDAYGRAYNLANSDGKFSTDKKADLLARAKQFYEVRHEDNAAGFDEWLKGLNATPFPDPASAVTPVVIAPPK